MIDDHFRELIANSWCRRQLQGSVLDLVLGRDRVALAFARPHRVRQRDGGLRHGLGHSTGWSVSSAQAGRAGGEQDGGDEARNQF